MARAEAEAEADASCLESFELYETDSKFYILGTNTDKTLWRLLKIDRMEPSELNIDEIVPCTHTVNILIYEKL